MPRFGECSLTNIQANVEDSKPANTVRSQTYIWAQFKEFCVSRNYVFTDNTPVKKLAEILEDWAFNMRQKTGEEYKESVVKLIWNVTAKLLQRKYFDEYNRSINPFSDQIFEKARNARNTKRKLLLQHLTQKRKVSAETFTKTEIEKIAMSYDENSPEGLQKKFYHIAASELAWHGKEGAFCLTDYFHKEKNRDGSETKRIEYYNPIYSKTTPGGNKSKWLIPNTENLDMCPVRLFNKMMSKRTINIKTNRLFLTPNKQWERTVWYKNIPIGVNELSKWTYLGAEKIGIDIKRKKFTNYSNRSSTVSNLCSDISNLQEKTITGHTSTNSLEPCLKLNTDCNTKVVFELNGNTDFSSSTASINETTSERNSNVVYNNFMDSGAGPSGTQIRRRTFLTKEEKKKIWTVYDGLKQTLPTNEATDRCAFLNGISVSTVERIVREITHTGSLEAPKLYNRGRKQLKLDDNQKQIIRGIVQSFCFENKATTLEAIATKLREREEIPPMSRETLRKILWDLNIRFNRCKKSILIDSALPIEHVDVGSVSTSCEEQSDSNLDYLPESDKPQNPRTSASTDKKMFCRLCLNSVTKVQMICLGDFHDIYYSSRSDQFKRNKSLQTDMYLRMIRTLMPNLDHDLVYNPVMCPNCSTSLQLASDFFERCMATQKLIQQFKDTHCPTDKMVACEEVVYNKSQLLSASEEGPSQPKYQKITEPSTSKFVETPIEIRAVSPNEDYQMDENINIKMEDIENEELQIEEKYDITQDEFCLIKQEFVEEAPRLQTDDAFRTNVAIKTEPEHLLPAKYMVKSEPCSTRTSDIPIMTNLNTIKQFSTADVSCNVNSTVSSSSSSIHKTNLPSNVPISNYPDPRGIRPETFDNEVNLIAFSSVNTQFENSQNR